MNPEGIARGIRGRANSSRAAGRLALPMVVRIRAVRTRGSANRSWSARRTGFPTIATPGFSDEPPHDDDHVRKGDPEVDDPSPLLGAPHQLLVGVVPGIGPLDDPSQAGFKRCGLAFLADHTNQSMVL